MIQTAVGGNRAENRYIELVVRGATAKISPILRTASDMSGGFIASLPQSAARLLCARHTRRSAASRWRWRSGEAIIAAEAKGGSAVIDAIVQDDRRHNPRRRAR